MAKLLGHLKKSFSSVKTYLFGMVMIIVMYVFLSIAFDFQDWMIGLYLLLLIPLVVGFYTLYQELLTVKYSIKWFDYDLIYAFLGVVLTYVIARELSISAVIGSSAIGLAGYLVFKNHSIAIYCGSFAGMVSAYVFNYYEVVSIAIICGFLFVLLKPMFPGIGGKLGTTAFISTILMAALLNKESIIVSNDIHFMRLMIVSVLGVIIPFYLTQKFKLSVVLTSSLPSLIYAILLIYLVKNYLPCAVVFFSASFIGMSSKKPLSSIYWVILSGIIHGFLFHVYFEHYNGLGGKLGLMAFTSVVIVVGIQVIYRTIYKDDNTGEVL